MLGNGTLTYDHDRDGRATELGGCTALVRNSIYDTFLLIRYSRNRLKACLYLSIYMLRRISTHLVYSYSSFQYTSLENLIIFFSISCAATQLMVNVDGTQEWKECADISGLHLPTGYFFGASSATGDLSGMTR